MTYQKETFDTLEALIAVASGYSPWGSRDSRKMDSAYTDFAGTPDFQTAQRLASNGWPEGLAKMRVALDAVQASNTALGAAPSYMLDVAGAYPVAAVAAAGDAFCMVAPLPVSERARPIIKLASSVATGSWATAEQIFNYGAALVAIIDALEGQGFSVELTSCRTVKTENHSAAIVTQLKGAGEALDLERMAFCLGNASFNRRINFGVLEARFDERTYSTTYGKPRLPEHGLDVDHDTCILPPVTSFDRELLSTPEGAFAAMAPAVMALLQDRFANMPQIIFPMAA